MSRPLLEKPGFGFALVAVSALAAASLVIWTDRPPWQAAAAHVLVLSFFAFILFAWDKRRAAAAKRRVSEANLWIGALLGGALGAWIAMMLLRHKTRHMAFRWLVPLAAIVHMGAIVLLALGREV